MSVGTIGVVFTARDRRSRGKAPAGASNSSFHHTKCIAGDHEPGDTLVIGNSDGLHKVGSVLRVENTLAQTTDFKVLRPPHDNPDGVLAWRPMRKGVATSTAAPNWPSAPTSADDERVSARGARRARLTGDASRCRCDAVRRWSGAACHAPVRSRPPSASRSCRSPPQSSLLDRAEHRSVRRKLTPLLG